MDISFTYEYAMTYIRCVCIFMLLYIHLVPDVT